MSDNEFFSSSPCCFAFTFPLSSRPDTQSFDSETHNSNRPSKWSQLNQSDKIHLGRDATLSYKSKEDSLIDSNQSSKLYSGLKEQKKCEPNTINITSNPAYQVC